MAITVKVKPNRIIVNGVASSASPELITNDSIVITNILWVKPTTIAHEAILADSDGDEHSSLYCSVASQPLNDDMNNYPTLGPLYCKQLDSGKLIIRYRERI